MFNRHYCSTDIIFQLTLLFNRHYHSTDILFQQTYCLTLIILIIVFQWTYCSTANVHRKHQRTYCSTDISTDILFNGHTVPRTYCSTDIPFHGHTVPRIYCSTDILFTVQPSKKFPPLFLDLKYTYFTPHTVHRSTAQGNKEEVET